MADNSSGSEAPPPIRPPPNLIHLLPHAEDVHHVEPDLMRDHERGSLLVEALSWALAHPHIDVLNLAEPLSRPADVSRVPDLVLKVAHLHAGTAVPLSRVCLS